MASTNAPVITVHWLENSRSQRILWLLEELELTYEIKTYKRNPTTRLAGEDLKLIHPLGKSPVITFEENGKVITLAESGAIVEYILERFGTQLFVAPGSEERANYLYWLHWAEGTAMSPLLFSIIFAQIPKQSPWFIRPITSAISSTVMNSYVKPKLRNNFKFVESELEGKNYFVDEKLTGADVMMIFPIEGLEATGELDNHPNIKSWLERMRSRDGYKKAEEKGGKVNLKAFIE